MLTTLFQETANGAVELITPLKKNPSLSPKNLNPSNPKNPINPINLTTVTTIGERPSVRPMRNTPLVQMMVNMLAPALLISSISVKVLPLTTIEEDGVMKDLKPVLKSTTQFVVSTTMVTELPTEIAAWLVRIPMFILGCLKNALISPLMFTIALRKDLTQL